VSSTHEITLALLYLTSALTGNSTLMALCSGGAWRDLVPPAQTPPWVIYMHQAGSDVMRFGSRAYSSMLFQVKVVGPASASSTLESGAAMADDAITTTSAVAVSGGEIKACYRAQPLAVGELVNGELWMNIGGLYRVLARTS
jgi:hypothetical protein